MEREVKHAESGLPLENVGASAEPAAKSTSAPTTSRVTASDNAPALPMATTVLLAEHDDTTTVKAPGLDLGSTPTKTAPPPPMQKTLKPGFLGN